MAAKKKLVIVESPSKAKTIGKFLGSKYKVMASVGHVRDLPKSRMGVKIEEDFEPEYINVRGKAQLIKELKTAASESDKVYLATDPDREGEAISWHICSLLDIPSEKADRVEFHEITKNAVTQAIEKPRSIDMNLVDAQQGRRVIDRVVGYGISPVLWNKVSRGLSAGRVQSAALKIICDRESQIDDFEPKLYFAISAYLAELVYETTGGDNGTVVHFYLTGQFLGGVVDGLGTASDVHEAYLLKLLQEVILFSVQ